MGRVEGKVAIVTGGASGIGEACCMLLAKEGAKVVVTDVNEEMGANVVNALVEQGFEALFIKHDVTSEQSWQTVIDQTVEKFGQLDILVNSAGVGLAKSFEEITLKDWRWLMSINLDGVFLGNKYAIGAMKNSQGASVINIASVLGLVGGSQVAAYSASKGAVRLLTKSVALYCAEQKYPIRVNSVHPGYISTPMIQYKPEQVLEALAKRHPIGRLGQSIDIAYSVLYLASDEAQFVTGSELVIDGGYTAQ